MKRLEHTCALPNPPSRLQANTPNGAVMLLGQTAREKHRLQQEKTHWESRLRRIEARLKEIGEMEKQLLAVAGFRAAPAQGEQPGQLWGRLPPGFTEVTISY